MSSGVYLRRLGKELTEIKAEGLPEGAIYSVALERWLTISQV